jgi:hypothetical protein
VEEPLGVQLSRALAEASYIAPDPAK